MLFNIKREHKLPLIELKRIYKHYRMGDSEQCILNDVSVSIDAGECVAIMGASGSGKSTLMNIMGLLDRPSSGTYLLQGRAVESRSDDELAQLRNLSIGFVFQQFYLLPRLTVWQNVALPLTYRRDSQQRIKQRVFSMLEKVSMQDKAMHKPNQLSGGQQQRVAIARALVGAPNIILADEPTGALDSKTSQDILELFLKLNEDEGKTLILVTHDSQVARQCQSQLWVQDGHLMCDGKGVASGV